METGKSTPLGPENSGYPVPADEAARLHTLRGYAILDTRPEESFDDLVHLAASICNAPMATISFVDAERQWFKSRVGVEPCETHRRDAFCAHTIMSPELFVVPDATLDPRFAVNPLVTGSAQIRFYAAAPIVAPDHHRIGALCVMDHVPRQLSASQLDALRILSRQVMAQVTLAKNLADLAQTLKAREELQTDLESLVAEYQKASDMIRTLKGLIPVCAWCKKVRDDKGYWNNVEAYIARSTGQDTTGAICPDCFAKNMGRLPERPGQDPQTS